MGVMRAIQPENSATSKPVTTPPSIMAGKDSPATKKPTATPGKIAWDKASPIRLRRRKIRNTPKGPAASDKAKVAANARRIKPKSLNGANKISHSAITKNPLHINDGPDVDYPRSTQIGRASCREKDSTPCLSRWRE